MLCERCKEKSPSGDITKVAASTNTDITSAPGRLRVKLLGEVVGTWDPLPDQSAQGDCNAKLEVTKLKGDLSELQTEVSRMIVTYHSEISNLRHKLQDAAGTMQQGMTTITEQVAEQGHCLAKALRHP